MPMRSIYIRIVDLPLWEDCKDKTQKISDMLNTDSTVAISTNSTYPKGETKVPGGKVIVSDTIITSPKDITKVLATEDNDGFCKHGAAIGFCKHGCKK